MKKKVLTAILPVCVAMAITACGGNAKTAEVTETTTTEESTETDAQAEPETQEEVLEEAPAEETVEEPAEVESEDVEFIVVTGDAVESDKRSEYGVFSNNCDDVYQFLDESGATPWCYDYEAKEWTEYSGRFAYPVPVEGFFKTAEVWSLTDINTYIAATTAGNETCGINIYAGTYAYDLEMQQVEYQKRVGDEYNGSTSCTTPFSITIGDKEEEVIAKRTEFKSYTVDVSFDEDGNVVDADGNVVEPIEIRIDNAYVYRLGGFTVDVSTNDVELTSEELQKYVDNIILLDGTDHSNDSAVTSDVGEGDTSEKPAE